MFVAYQEQNRLMILTCNKTKPNFITNNLILYDILNQYYQFNILIKFNLEYFYHLKQVFEVSGRKKLY